MNPRYILGKLDRFRGRRTIVVKDQQVPDIITAILNADKIYAKEYDKIAMDFWTGDIDSTAKKIFSFIKKNFKYRIESDSNQRILSPSAILTLGKYGIDCKNYALFIYGILNALKRKSLFNNKLFYRFASYKMFDEIPHHVFVVYVDNTGNEVYVDPVLPSFNDRSKTFFHKLDKANNMALYSVSGIGDDMGRIKKKKKKSLPTSASAQAVKSTSKPKKVKKKIVLKIALSPARTAFLTLVGLNFGGLATKLSKAQSTHADALTNLWKNFGGDPNKLIEKISKGKGKKRIFGMGVIDPVTATAVATSAPLLIKIGEFLKKIGINPDEIVKAGKTLLAQAIKNKTAQIEDAQAMQEEKQQQQLDEMTDQTSVTGKSKMLIPLLIGGGIVVYMLMKKK